MPATLLHHREVRAALSAADELSREEHALGADSAAQVLAALRTALGDVDLALGRAHAVDERLLDAVHDRALKLQRTAERDGAAHEDRRRLRLFVQRVMAVEETLRSPHHAPARRRAPRTEQVRLARTWIAAGCALAGATALVTWLVRR